MNDHRKLFQGTLSLWEAYTADRQLANDDMLQSIGAQLRYLLDVCDEKASPNRLDEIVIGVTAARFWGWGAPKNDDLEQALYECQVAVERMR